MIHRPENNPKYHTIRLRGPCTLHALDNGQRIADVRVQIPCGITPSLFGNRLDHDPEASVLVRRFSKPTGLLNTQEVRLELKNFTEVKRVLLNRGCDCEMDLEVFNGDFWSGEISQKFQQRNTLEIEFGSMPAVAGEISLLIFE